MVAVGKTVEIEGLGEHLFSKRELTTLNNSQDSAPNLYLNVCTIMCKLNTVVKSRLNETFKSSGIQHQHWQILKILYYHEAQTPSQIASLMHITKPLISRSIERLEVLQLIERKMNHQDRRVVDLVITEKGREHTEKGLRALKELPEMLESALTSEQLNKVSFGDNQFVIGTT